MAVLRNLSAGERVGYVGIGCLLMYSLGSWLGGVLDRPADIRLELGATAVQPARVEPPALRETLEPGEPSAEPRTPSAPRPAESATGGVVSLNSATEADLDTLPGVGPATARKILEYRALIGQFRSVEELLEVKGIGEKKLAKMRPYLRL